MTVVALRTSLVRKSMGTLLLVVAFCTSAYSLTPKWKSGPMYQNKLARARFLYDFLLILIVKSCSKKHACHDDQLITFAQFEITSKVGRYNFHRKIWEEACTCNLPAAFKWIAILWPCSFHITRSSTSDSSFSVSASFFILRQTFCLNSMLRL